MTTRPRRRHSGSHGVKIEVKQVDDNYTWLYNENEYLKVELSDFCNYGEMLLNSVAHFTKAALVTRQHIPKDISHPRVSYLIHLAA